MILTKTYNFYQWLHYEDGLGTGTPCWNGNVSGMEWESLDALAALLHHEWYGHGIKRYGNRTGTHHKVYESQIKTMLFHKTTDSYKEYILNII